MRFAVIFGLGTSPAELKPFLSDPATEWWEGLPGSSCDCDAILIFGGDGTIHRHLPALVRLQLPLLVVPTGSGNDFARALGLRSARDSLRAWREFLAGRISARAIDLGVIAPLAAPEARHYFCCVAGCGLDSAVARLANRMPRWMRGHGGYALALLPMLLNLPAFPMSLSQGNVGEPGNELEGNATKRTLLAAFANTQFYGDGMRIAPEADFADGKLDVCRISAMKLVHFLLMFPTVYVGRHLLSPKVEYSKVESVMVHTEVPTEIYADGEFVCATPAEISVAPGALRVISAPR